MEKCLKSNQIYSGKVLKYNIDEVELPDGNKGIRETVSHPGGVGILVIKDDFVYLVKQYRYVFDKDIIEIPAGKLDKNENHELAAKRELKEELGLTAKNLIFLGEFYPSVGYTNEIIYLYFANEFEQGEQKLDDDEFLDKFVIPFDEFKSKIKNNEIKDGKTIAALHLFENLK